MLQLTFYRILESFEKFLNLIMLLSGFLGLTSSIVIIVYNNSRKFFNTFLVSIFVLTAVQLILKSTYNLNFQDSFNELNGSSRFLLIIKLPLFFLYLKILTLNLKKLKPQDYLQLIIPFVFFAIHLLLKNLTLNNSFIRYLFSVTILTYFGYYLFKMYKLLQNYWRNKEIEYAYHFKTLNNWIKLVVLIFLLLTIRLITGFVYEFSTDKIIDGNSTNYIASILWLTLFIKLFLTPEILYGFTFPEKDNSNELSVIKKSNYWLAKEHEITNPIDLKLRKLLSDNVYSIIVDIDNKTSLTDFFQDPQASMKSLAKAINKPSSHVVFVFKYFSTIGFSEYRNNLRIEHAKRLIYSDFLVNNTLESLSVQVGFSSYNPFYSAFKKQVGKSPNEYAKKSK